jgi:hypothetical protein
VPPVFSAQLQQKVTMHAQVLEVKGLELAAVLHWLQVPAAAAALVAVAAAAFVAVVALVALVAVVAMFNAMVKTAAMTVVMTASMTLAMTAAMVVAMAVMVTAAAVSLGVRNWWLLQHVRYWRLG